MASAPANALPLFYKDLQPLSSQAHANWKFRTVETAEFFATAQAVPLTVDEFILAQRHYPIVFSAGPNPVPLALFGLNDGVNVFSDEQGVPTQNIYIPAYIRRYPFFLARLREDSEDLSLCFDETSGMLGDFEDGEPLFEGSEPTEPVKNVLAFCEQYEQSWIRTGQFMQELEQNKLLVERDLTIEAEGTDQSFVYRGFQIIDEEKLKDLRGDVLRKMIGNGLLPLIHAHLFSVSMIRDIFAMQMQQGKAPQPNGGTIA